MGRPSHRDMQALCDRFNLDHPIGSEVMFFPGALGENGQIGTVRAPAEILSGHTPVAWIEGARGCVALSHVQPVPQDAKGVSRAAPDLLSIARRWVALDGGAWHVDRHAREKAELLADTRAAIVKATGDA